MCVHRLSCKREIDSFDDAYHNNYIELSHLVMGHYTIGQLIITFDKFSWRYMKTMRKKKSNRVPP